MTIVPPAVWVHSSGLYYLIMLKQGRRTMVVRRVASEAAAVSYQMRLQALLNEPEIID